MKNKDWMEEETPLEASTSKYKKNVVQIVDLELHEKNPDSENKLIQSFGNIVEISLEVIKGPLKGKKTSIFGFAKTRSGDWAVYPVSKESVRPIFREVLDRIFEYDPKLISLEIFKPSFLKDKLFEIEMKEIDTGNDSFIVTLTDYQRYKDKQYINQKENEDESEEEEELVDVDDIPF